MDRTPPVGLAGAGRRLWLAIWDNSIVPHSPQLHEVLLLACKQADRAAECREVLSKSGLLAEDRFGQEKPHPLITVERQATGMCASLVAQLVGKIAGEVKEAIEQEEDFFG